MTREPCKRCQKTTHKPIAGLCIYCWMEQSRDLEEDKEN